MNENDWRHKLARDTKALMLHRRTLVIEAFVLKKEKTMESVLSGSIGRLNYEYAELITEARRDLAFSDEMKDVTVGDILTYYYINYKDKQRLKTTTKN